MRVRITNGVPTSEFGDFLTSFVIDDRDVWEHPVGVVVARDEVLLVTEDGNGTLWRVSWIGSSR